MLLVTDRYSFETCMTECRMRNYIEICGCVPYKYPRIKGLDERNCLCRLECNDKKYSVDSDVMPLIATDLPGNVTSAGDFVRVHIEMDHVISIWGDLAVGHGPDVDSASDSIPGLNPALDADPNRALGVLIQT
ncbi:hypothetical protein EVAR_67103_1 [Eumeta japonica]|uniref:Sodium channel protein Nach n=1 Tax=Eumeta variegata TaxID=151549 RepID=A0A4C1ZXB4_EUMVA|nr:hypothetical protein EVAR_67103_1 [Eumeta japonica]